MQQIASYIIIDRFADDEMNMFEYVLVCMFSGRNRISIRVMLWQKKRRRLFVRSRGIREQFETHLSQKHFE